MKHFKISVKFNFLIMTLSLVIIFLFLIFIFIIKKPVSGRIDFITDFASAVKNNFKEDKAIDKYLPANRYVIAVSYLKEVNVKLFSRPTVLLSKNGVTSESVRNDVAEGCFRTVFKKLPAQPVRFNYYIKKKGPNDYWLVSISMAGKNLIEITDVANSKPNIIERMEIPVRDISFKKLNILFTADFLFIFTDQNVLFQCKHPGLSGKGGVDFIYQGGNLNSEYSVKFGSLTDDMKKKLSDCIEKQNPSMPFHKYTYSDPQWNLMGSEDGLANAGSESCYIRRLKLKNTTMPSIYFLPGSSLKYDLKIAEKSSLSFHLAFYHPVDSFIPRGIFYVKISDDDEKLSDKYKFRCSDILKGDAEFNNFRIDLQKYSGKKCAITFSYEINDIDKYYKGNFFPSVPIAALGSPVIYPTRGKKEKNVILISIDTLRPDHLGIYGYSRNTSPCIDRFARDSVLFLKTTAQSNWTLTSHMSIFSSMYPFETGYHRGIDIHQNVRFAENVKLIPEYLKENGYKTGAITGGGYVSEFFGYDKGMDFYNIVEKKINSKIASDCSTAVSKAIEWIKESGNSKFFLFFHTYEVHKPYNHEDFLKELDLKSAGLLEKTIAEYDSGILYTDREIGRLIAWLKKNNLYDNTLIIITSDHGENFNILDREKIPGGHGMTLYDSEIQVPLIIGGAVEGQKGRVIENQTSLVDIMPTILDYLDIPVPDDIRGISLRKMIDGKERGGRLSYSEAVFTGNEKKSLRSVQYKIIENFKNERDKIKTGLEFYDLTKDRDERKNIAGENFQIKNSFISRLHKIIFDINEKRKALSAKPGKRMSDDKDLENQLKALGYLGN